MSYLQEIGKWRVGYAEIGVHGKSKPFKFNNCRYTFEAVSGICKLKIFDTHGSCWQFFSTSIKYMHFEE